MVATAQGNLTVVGSEVYWKGTKLPTKSFTVRKRDGSLRIALEVVEIPDFINDLYAAGIIVRKVHA